jgi:two-component system, NtrC family, sensor kinase
MQRPIHRLLQRQLKRFVKGLEAIPLEWQPLLSGVNEAYYHADDDRLRLERTLELSSQELLAANQDLQRVLASVEQQVSDRTMELTTANAALARTLAQLQQAQAQLIQVEKMSSLGQLVAGVVHELNNPVTFIYGNLRYVMDYMQVLVRVIQQYQSAYPQPSAMVRNVLAEVDLDFVAVDLPKVIDSISAGTQRIEKIVQALRTFSRLDEAEVKRVDIHDGLESTLMLLNRRLRLAKCGSIGIQTAYADLPLVECYAGHLNQVFLNLLTNAIDALEGSSKFTAEARPMPDFEAMPGGLRSTDWEFLQAQRSPMIELTTRLVDGAMLEIQILDNADGIPLAIHDRLFDPFFTTKAVGAGMGMGLSTSYQVVTSLHGGNLTCRSTVGWGSAFVIQIPL